MGISEANHSHSYYSSNGIHRPIETTMLAHNLSSPSSSCLPPSPASTPTNSTHTVKKRKAFSRSVSFGSTDVAYIENANDLTAEEKDCRWYQLEELQEIKAAARGLCVQETKGSGIGEDDSTRGMDVYYPSRQRNNRKFVEHVLEAYHFRCAGNAEHVRQLVERWSTKSRQRASMKAQQDYLDAYAAQSPREW